MNNAKNKVWTTLGVSALIVGYIMSDVHSSSIATTPTSSVQQKKEAVLVSLEEGYSWELETWVALSESGLEMGAAGFHLIRPWCDPWKSGLIQLDKSRTGHCWWGVETQSKDGYYSTPIGTDPIAPASYRKAFSAKIVQISSVETSPGVFEVRAYFSPKTLDFLKVSIGIPSPTIPHLDWFLESKSAGEDPTDYRVCVVSEDKAYEPFSVRDLANGVIPSTVVVAKKLTEIEASKLISKLGQ